MSNEVITSYKTDYNDPLTIIDIANYFLLKETMSQKKIQKLCYYAYALFLASADDDEELVKDCKFEAWAHGPVNKELRAMFKEFGWRDLKIVDSDVASTKDILYKKLGKDLVEFLDDVWDTYKDFSADELERLTHSEKPWIEKREGLGIYDRSSRKISNKTMREFYRNNIIVDG